MYDFTVNDCTQKQNGSPYYSFIIRQCRRLSPSERLSRFRNFASIVTWRHTSLAPATSYLLRKKISCKRLYEHKCNRKLKGNILPTRLLEKNSWWPEITHPTPQELNGRPLKGTWTSANKSYQLHLFRFVFSENFLCSFWSNQPSNCWQTEFNWICFLKESVKALISASKFDALILTQPWTTQPWF